MLHVDGFDKLNFAMRPTVLSALFISLVIVFTLSGTDVFWTSDIGRESAETIPQPKRIDKTKHIAFLKIPKCGSSTLTCTFFRFGIKNNLNIFLPKSTIFVSLEKQKQLMKIQKSYDIFATHTIYDREFFTSIVSKNSAVIALVREPIHRMISHAFYKSLFRRKEFESLSEKQFIHAVLRNTSRYGIEHITAKFFGIETDKTNINQYLDRLNTSFSLVLVLERFNESLVLLKRTLNWSFADILFGPRKVRTYEQVTISTKERQTVISNNMHDFKIYNYFKKELERKIKQQGNDFQAEVLHFENILNNVKTFCNDISAGINSSIEIPSSKWDRSFQVLSSECDLIYKLDVQNIRRKYGDKDKR